MFVRLPITAVLTTIHIHLASAFQLGSDYDVYKTAGFYNCTGNTPVSDVTVRNAFDTLPQIDSSSSNGWEQWTLYSHSTFSFILRWNTGNPSSSTVPSPAHFDIIANINGFPGELMATGDLSYTNNDNLKQIDIAGNTLTWDAEALWFNVSVNVAGYQIQIYSFSGTLDSFHPDVAFYNGLLDQSGSWFGSVPLIRGRIAGSFVTPTNQHVTLNGLSALRHMFSDNPLPSYVNKYTAGTLWGYSTEFYDTHIFYQTETTDGTAHEAAFLGRALPAPEAEGAFSSAWATYAVTDDSLYALSISPLGDGIEASFTGCANTNNVPYLFNTSALTLFGAFPDAGGGVTTYYVFNGTTSAEFNGFVMNGTLAGFYEEYVVPVVNV